MGERAPHLIPIAWVSREDLIHCCPDLKEQIQILSDADVDYLAEKVGDALQETYWLAMEIMLADFFELAESEGHGMD